MTKKLTKSKQIEKLEEQIEQLKAGIEREEKTKARYQEQVDVWQELMAIKLDGVAKGLIKPEYQHHMNPRFWELQVKEMQFKVEEETEVQQGQLAQYDYKIDAYSKEVETLTKELEKMRG